MSEAGTEARHKNKRDSQVSYVRGEAGEPAGKASGGVKQEDEQSSQAKRQTSVSAEARRGRSDKQEGKQETQVRKEHVNRAVEAAGRLQTPL